MARSKIVKEIGKNKVTIGQWEVDHALYMRNEALVLADQFSQLGMGGKSLSQLLPKDKFFELRDGMLVGVLFNNKALKGHVNELIDDIETHDAIIFACWEYNLEKNVGAALAKVKDLAARAAVEKESASEGSIT
jgi:hypothetical protein